MKNIPRSIVAVSTLLSVNLFPHAQETNHTSPYMQTTKTNTNLRVTESNKEAILHLYKKILNQRKFDLLRGLIADSYVNGQGGKGIEGFQQQIISIISGLPDAHWEVEMLIAESDTVIVKQKLKGTHYGLFQNIPASGKSISVSGTGYFYFRNGKLINSKIEPDRLEFLQQVGVLPSDLSAIINQNTGNENVCFIEKFSVPKESKTEFVERMNDNRRFISTIPGFIKDKVYEKIDETGNSTIITIAIWQNEQLMDNAKKLMQAEFKRVSFDPTDFLPRLGITLERGAYYEVRN